KKAGNIMRIDSIRANTGAVNGNPNKMKKSSKSEYTGIAGNVQKASGPLFSAAAVQELMKPSLDGTHEINIGRYMTEIQQQLKENGLTLDGECSIRIGTDGRLAVYGDSCDKEKLESILNSNEELSEKLRNEMIMQQHAERMKKSMAFNKVYAQNMQMAVSRFGYLFNNSYNIEIILEIGQDSFDMQSIESV
ncbi:MAG TPA: hypothetical protein VN580_11700, partial [Clostridia bacterium]|nr:hypothetical protein [Clostridia bacterium]